MQTEIELLEEIASNIDKNQTKVQKEFSAFKENDFESLKIQFVQLYDELKEMKARGGRIAPGLKSILSTADLISEAIIEKGAEIAALTKAGKVNYSLVLKTVGVMTASNNLTGSTVTTYAATPETRPRAQMHFRDLVRVVPSATGTWVFYRQNSIPGEGSFSVQSSHGSTKSQVDFDLTQVTINAEFLSGFLVIAKQMLADIPFMSSFISSELVESYLLAEDNKFFGELYSVATGTGDTSTTVTAERIIGTIANLAENHFYPNAVVVTNPVWAKILKTKPSDYSVPGGINVTNNGEITIAGVPLVRTTESNLGANKMLIGDFSRAALIQAEGLSVAFSEHDDINFRKNLVTARAECRIALATLSPAAFAYVTAGTT